MKFLVTAIFSILIASGFGANILYLSSVASPSHFIWCRSLLTSLHARGHNITALSGDVEESKENFTYLHLDKIYDAFYNGSQEINFLEMGEKSFAAMFLEFIDLIEYSCVATLNSKGYSQLLDYPADFKFDLIIYDFTMSGCLMGMVDKYSGTPMVSVTPFLFSAKTSDLSGSLFYPSFFPTADGAFPQSMTFTQRLQTTVQTVLEFLITEYFMMPKIEKIVRSVHPGIPTIQEIEKKATRLILVNSHPVSDYRQPAMPHVKLVGGAQIQNAKDLPAELKTIADNAKNGLVFFSLGTNMRSDTLGSERIVKIIKAFARLPQYTFFWKFETKELLPIDLPKNVHIRSWMPQNDILAHPNTKLFISHCGLLSSQESLWHGKIF